MYTIRILGLIFCPVLLCFFSTIGLFGFLRSQGLDRRLVMLISLLTSITLMATMLYRFHLELRARHASKSRS
ncbi:MAG: hypothetical protein QM770_21160 [Tepidisphaeraceae bacterium]